VDGVSREVEIACLTDGAALDRLPADRWDALVEALPRPSPYLLHGWVTSRVRHRVGGAEPQVHVARRDGRLVGVLPLEVVRRRGMRVGGFAGGPSTTWPDVLLAADEPEETARLLVASARRSSCDFHLFEGIARDSRIAELADLVLVERYENARFDFGRGWEVVYREKISKRHRQDYRKKREQLAALGRLETRVARSADELNAVLDDTVRLHELRWGSRYDASGYGGPASRAAMREAVARLAERGSYRIVTLELDGTPIAFLSHFVVAGTAVGHRTGFDPAYGAHSPGALVFFDAFAACEADGITRFEFGGGDDRYKTSLADVMEPLYDGIGLARGARGTLAAPVCRQVLVQGRRMRRSPRVRTAYKRVRDAVHRG